MSIQGLVVRIPIQEGPFLDSLVQFLLLKCCSKLFFGQRSVQYYECYEKKYLIFTHTDFEMQSLKP